MSQGHARSLSASREKQTVCGWPARRAHGGGLLRGPCMRAHSSHPPPTRPLARRCGWCRPRVCRRVPESHPHANVLSRLASVRGGRCGAANDPLDPLDNAGTARTDASFDSRDLLLFSRLGGRFCTAPGGQRLCSHRARSRMHQGVRGSEVGGHRRTCRCRPMLRVLEPVRDELELPVSRLQKRQMVTSTR